MSRWHGLDHNARCGARCFSPWRPEFPKIGVPYLGVLIIRILLFGVLYEGPLCSETPRSLLKQYLYSPL